jgi:hypothetical protein
MNITIHGTTYRLEATATRAEINDLVWRALGGVRS